MIHLENVWKTYEMGDQKLHALREINEEIRAGEHVALIGPSGSGKSTLLNIIGCLDQPTQGSYSLDGTEISHRSPQELADIRLHELGFIFQAFHLVPRLTALENVALPMVFAGISKAERTQRAKEVLTSIGLEPWFNHRPAELSGGQKQRVAIARATVMNPRILLADEPTGNLDSVSGAQVLELLHERNRQGITLITVTHDPNVARQADRVLVLRDGMILRSIAGSQLKNLSELFADLDDGDAAADAAVIEEQLETEATP
jgi:putative ABC transport system ATP-binding protein